jgi:hypothetical protein
VLVHIPKGSKKPRAWLADFGLSVVGDEATTFMTKPFYRAPEFAELVEDRRPIDSIPLNELEEYKEKRRVRARQMEKADVFSFGLVAFYVSTSNFCSLQLTPYRSSRFCRC